jgi:hypothetical protein
MQSEYSIILQGVRAFFFDRRACMRMRMYGILMFVHGSPSYFSVAYSPSVSWYSAG